jgi:Ni/Co efflux regulator RcnB
MATVAKLAVGLAAGLICASGVIAAEQGHEHGGEHAPAHAAAPAHGEPHPGPQGYQRVAEPAGWNKRPATVDRGAYQHNYQAARTYQIGPYHRPAGWVARRWAYGQILPRGFWAPQYVLADYWLFSLEVPPVGFEWVRYGNDALLINTSNGEILQVEYGVFG